MKKKSLKTFFAAAILHPLWAKVFKSETISVPKHQKKFCSVRQNLPKNKLFCARLFCTLYKKKFSNLSPLLFITFLQGFRISKHFGHLTSGSGGKICLSGTSKVNRHTDTHTDISTYIKHQPRAPMLWKCNFIAKSVVTNKVKSFAAKTKTKLKKISKKLHHHQDLNFSLLFQKFSCRGYFKLLEQQQC